MDRENSIPTRARRLTHNGAIYYLLGLGNLTDHKTYTHHRQGKHRGTLLGNVATMNSISELVKPVHADVVKRIDVVWFKEKCMTNCFEVVHTTSMPYAALKLHQVLDCENLDKVHLVFPARRRNQFYHLSSTSPFDKQWEKYGYVIYERLLEVHDLVEGFKRNIEESEARIEKSLSSF